jgi:lipoprotein-anchoring transpeptidase ErfK/SrfK
MASPGTDGTMSDYYSILRKAVADPDRTSAADRQEIYERARRMVVGQLRAADPPWPEADIDEQIETLDAAVARLESEIEGESSRRTPPDRTARHDPPVEQALRPSDREAVALPRRRTRWALVGVSAAILLAVLGGLWLASSDQATVPTPTPAQPPQSASIDQQRPADAAADPPHASYVLRKQHVYYRTTHPPGTIMISRNQKFLYVVQPNTVAIRYAIGVGPECVEVAGLFRVTDKVSRLGAGDGEPRGIAASPKGDAEFRPGPRILYFGDRHAVHGTTEPTRIGQSTSFGCFHQWNQDIVDLYDRVPLNERVVVAN